MIEIFREIQEFKGYFISNFGRVKSTKGKTNRILKQSLDSNGYCIVNLSNGLYRKTLKIHKLVAILFLGHKPIGYSEIIDHKDNDKTNNHVSNLQRITARKNCSKDRFRQNPKSQYVGVSPHNDKWRAKIYINGKQKHLGLFDDEFNAHLAYQSALKTQVNAR